MRVVARSVGATVGGSPCEDDDERDTDDSLAEYESSVRGAAAMEQLAASLGTTMSAIEKALAMQGMLLLKIADQAAKGPAPANVSVDVKPVEARPRAFNVEVIRGRDNLISELVIKPVGDANG
jgi:hypothetical protein